MDKQENENNTDPKQPSDQSDQTIQTDPLLTFIKDLLKQGDMKPIHKFLDQKMQQNSEDLERISQLKEQMNIDPIAIYTASVCAAILLVIMLITLFH